MTRDKFILHMVHKGYGLRVFNKEIHFNQGVSTVILNANDSVGSSNPSGNFNYKTVDDFIDDKPSDSEEYLIID